MNSLYKSLITILLLSQTACSFNASLFGWSDNSSTTPVEDGDDTTVTKVKGTFPMGDPAFTGEFKNYITATADGKIVFATFDHKVIVASNTGTVLHQFDPVNVDMIMGIAVDSNNKIYITGHYDADADQMTDNYVRFIKKYELDGTFISELATFTDEDPADPAMYIVFSPENPVITSDGSIYVSNHEQIRKYSGAGGTTLLDTIGTAQGSNDGEINGTNTFYVETDGSIYVVDTWTSRLQKFDANGNFVSKFTWPRQVANSIPAGLFRESDGSFVVTERMGADGRVTKFSSTGVLTWVKDGSERPIPNGNPTYDSNMMSLTRYNNKYYLGFRDEVVIYNSDGTFSGQHVKMLSGAAATFRLDNGTFFVGAGNGIHRFNAKGEWQDSFASGRMVYGLTATNDTLYAVDPTTPGLIYKYDFDGNALGTINFGGAGQAMFLSIDKDKNNLYVSDIAGLYKVPVNTEVAAPFGAGTFTMVTGISPQADGTFVILDFDGVAQSTPKRLNADGTLAATTFDVAGSGLSIAYNLATDSTGKIYVSDVIAKKVVIFGSDGTYLTTFTHASIAQPIGIMIDKYDDIFIADGTANNVKKFDKTGAIQVE
ncbi:hypothetical protein ACES2L_06515 [Bdellovibrio bacteriovorus]